MGQSKKGKNQKRLKTSLAGRMKEYKMQWLQLANRSSLQHVAGQASFYVPQEDVIWLRNGQGGNSSGMTGTRFCTQFLLWKKNGYLRRYLVSVCERCSVGRLFACLHGWRSFVVVKGFWSL